ncbi:MAG: hypothetical protein UR28_C0002G0076 [Candidatus Peregrinibacteria bacterium GW2011_GWF2_33_10]|nr:MAG: hypothetical protein UR28_C0002G0076 [Candidatus Peregrinibacteria bacterium GW2011_GWF2_33_10]OGJ45270.1 MAG: hypothetical protein A2263_01675 [Candidatus Peregrinibacteria bacterium RIFOXYA2_FULL_33_21]OGJ46248.1 MAG: hypothetical protein A2272_04200 [Candidatus Peregrinibacteria bacterium RIFOXYA12_FULL_33_12]OGJ51242.1 MAG: hypothetical protein A2307_01335 [Candidatus Peregrinibacteria bacterium RIFOXYB2_FULL_33_20]
MVKEYTAFSENELSNNNQPYIPEQPIIEKNKNIHLSVETRLEKILSNWQVRPEPLEIAELIREGLTLEDIIKIGEKNGIEQPKMDITLFEINNMIPYIHKIVDHIFINYPGYKIIFLGRDAEIIYDLFKVKYGTPSVLLPASTSLWKDGKFDNGKLGKVFLETYGINDDVLVNPESKFLLFDSGFRGSIAYFIRRAIISQFSLDDDYVRQKFPIKLVSMIYSKGYGTQLMQFDFEKNFYTNDPFPKVSQVVGYTFQDHEFDTYGCDRFAYRLAMSMQLLPHYHHMCDSILEVDDKIIGVPTRKEISNDVDTIIKNEENADGRNASIVNPVAAIIAQYKVLKSVINT